MPTLNPHFRQVDNIVVPANINTTLGWTDGKTSLTDAQRREAIGLDRITNDIPLSFRSIEFPPLPEVVKAWNEFQQSKGRYPGSCDWTLLDEFAISTVLTWKPQIIGSCVASNTFRGWVIRLMYQIVFLGLGMEYLGRNQYTKNNYAFYVPYTYGSARRRGNMKGGDGLYADVMTESLLKDGVLSCLVPKLLEILKVNGFDKDTDFPEPQNERYYRRWGDWEFLDQVKEYADFQLEECLPVKNADQLKSNLENCKPCFFCSGIAIRKAGIHKDGFTIHVRDPGNSWAHNMCFHGFLIASDSELFFRFSNESWGLDYIYNVSYNEVVNWFKNQRPTSYAIGMIKGPQSAPPLIA